MREHACSSVTVFESFLLRVRTPPPNARFSLVLLTRANEVPRTDEIKGALALVLALVSPS